MLPWMKKMLHPSRNVVRSDQAKDLVKIWRILNVQTVTTFQDKPHYTSNLKFKISMIPQKILKSLRPIAGLKRIVLLSS